MSDRHAVTLAEIDAQRDAGWPDFHPEDYCHRCGGVNPVWWIDSDRFNLAMGRPSEHRWNGIVCPGCFAELHAAATGLQTVWTMIPDPHIPMHPPRDEALAIRATPNPGETP